MTIREFTNEEIGSGRTALNGRYDWHGMRLGASCRGEIGGNQGACTSLPTVSAQHHPGLLIWC
ncbi:hypothetical protein I7I53_08682 [Histoplasma capsulatum var. duboisii H88]|uniref:Uncharacterized protein n=1 Tax=Ajellomyces capsulatus (strain H88) TaxID=544711 RepID=A0A8A1LJU3_AJEC8|nr:hypothetical protein I7I53_08682 [Histoplasma capsulatum var. duboisii H88]